MTNTGQIYTVGIVDRVSAKRNNAGEVLRLETTVRIETKFETTYYGQDYQVDELVLSLPVDAQVNPGDVVAISMLFESPTTARFQPALEASNGDEDELEVMVEDGMVEEAHDVS